MQFMGKGAKNLYCRFLCRHSVFKDNFLTYHGTSITKFLKTAFSIFSSEANFGRRGFRRRRNRRHPDIPEVFPVFGLVDALVVHVARLRVDNEGEAADPEVEGLRLGAARASPVLGCDDELVSGTGSVDAGLL